EATGAKLRLQVHDDERTADRRDDRPGRGSQARPRGQLSAEPNTRGRSDDSDKSARDENGRDRERNRDDQRPDEHGRRRRHAEHVGETAEPQQLAPRAPAAQREEHADADDEEPHVERDDAENRAPAHRTSPIEMPLASCQRTTYEPPSSPM